MKITYENNNTKISGAKNFDLGQTFECGQCFRFDKDSDGLYKGTAFGKTITAGQDGEGITLYGVGEREFESLWRGYFDLDRDYAGIIKALSFDERVSVAASSGAGGIRILNQDGWETLCSFIVSQNNNIPRIKKIIASLCSLLGEETGGGFYSFPSAEAVAGAGIEGLAPIRSGFRAKYIIDAAESVASGKVKLDGLSLLPYDEAKAELMKIKGVGDKVSDCALLFGFGFRGAFPKDVWIKRTLEKYYGADFSPSEYFGEHAGIAQQYLFYYERSILKKIAGDN